MCCHCDPPALNYTPSDNERAERESREARWRAAPDNARAALADLGWKVERNTTWQWTASKGAVWVLLSPSTLMLNLFQSSYPNAMLANGLTVDQADTIASALSSRSLSDLLLWAAGAAAVDEEVGE